MSLTQEQADQLNRMREAILAGHEYSREELAEAVMLMREARTATSSKSSAPAAAKKSELPDDLNSLFE